MRAKCCGCTEAFQASRAGSIPVARLRTTYGEWRSLVAHSAGGRAVAGSNPVSPIQNLLRRAPGAWLCRDAEPFRACDHVGRGPERAEVAAGDHGIYFQGCFT